MKPDKETLEQFKKIYQEEFNEELSDEAALEQFSRLINALRILYFPDQFPSLDVLERYAIVRTEK